ncbi:sarcosine oxidase subunit gamma [Halocynthiibacter namhaensis]|uniref:sarcosine oxidase subunit gamma n=1 Tax=Halocynthiibacter namhaensis TaxID=1290553 RepID=UPI000578F6CF|nr:sarcosine oxidase subunit gamma [Halocynthiibacter namhaensis]
MADYIAKTPCDGLLPQTIGSLTLTETAVDRMTSFMPWKGREKTASKALKAACGVAFPGPNETSASGDVQAIWTGRGQCFILGVELPDGLSAEGALTDQSDAWAVMSLRGDAAVDVLARLCPVDLRDAAFKPGDTVRTEMQHMMVSVTRMDDGFQIMVMRSFAKTAVHDLTETMKAIAARA